MGNMVRIMLLEKRFQSFNSGYVLWELTTQSEFEARIWVEKWGVERNCKI
jgi:hypothetical protein